MIEVQKVRELDVVELTEDLPQYGLCKGAHGTVVEVFDHPEEGYMVEFIDSAGTISKIADWVRPDQIESLDIRAAQLFERGFRSLKKGDLVDAAEQLHKAIYLRPSCIRILHNYFAETFGRNEAWEQIILGMNFLLEIDPTYVLARENLAIAYLNYGVEMAKEGDFAGSLNQFLRAVQMNVSDDLIVLIRQNLTSSHVALGVLAYKSGNFEEAVKHMQSAYTFNSNTLTRRNLGTAYLVWADQCLARKDYDDAIRHYLFAEETGLVATEGLNNRAVAHVHQLQFDEAIRALETALTVDSDNEVAKSNLSFLKANRQILSPELIEHLRTEHLIGEFLTVPQTTSAALMGV